MAVSVNADPDIIELRLVWTDEAGEDAPIVIPLAGDSTDANIATLVDHLIALSNASLDAQLKKIYNLTGITNAGKPAVTAQPLVAAIFAMDFQKVNPVNASKSVSKQVLVPAYINAIRNDGITPHVPVTDNADLNAIYAYLETNLQFVGSDGLFYPGSWTYNPASKFGTKLTVTDGL